MRNAVMLEGLESRKLFSASLLSARAVTVIGPTSGSVAAAATPHFDSLETDGQSTDDHSNAAAARTTSIRVKFTRADSGVGISAANLQRQAVQITNLNSGQVYNGTGAAGTINIQTLLQKVKTSGGGDILVLSPNGLWDANTTYKVEINGSYATSGQKVTDVNGAVFDAFGSSTTTFTTGTFVPTPNVTSAFTMPATQTAAGTNPYTALAMGPDGKLYAATTDGFIYRFAIGSDGTLTADATITSIRDNNGGARIITGIAFDPGSTSTNLVLWVSHGQYRFGNNPSGSDDVQKYADNFTGKITRISGTTLQNYQDIVVGIPRSVKDHMNNQLVFSPDKKALYFGIAAMNAMGEADTVWGNRVENIYSGTIMQIRLGSGTTGLNTYMHASGAINLAIDGNQNTATGLVPGTTHYNIFKGTNPLRIYADGVRNDFDLVFAANGHLYAGINGSSAGGNTPGTPSDLSTVPTQNRPDKGINGTTYAGPTAPGLTNVQTIEEDTLLDVKNAAYYGHPNATRGEYILDGANPTSGTDPFEFAGNGHSGSTGYAVGQQPDRNYTRPVYDFGQDFSPDGLLQYKSVNGVNADLNNYILVARYSSGSDILALKTNADGSIARSEERIPGFTSGSGGLDSPLDMVEDPNTGNIYVAQLMSEVTRGSIVLLKPTTAAAAAGTATLNKTKLGFYVTPGNTTGAAGTVKITNTGAGSITIDRSATKISGKFRKNFGITNLPADDMVLAAGASFTFNLKGVLAAGQTYTPNTELAIRVLNSTNGNYYATVNLRAIDSATVSTQSFTPQSYHSQLAVATNAVRPSVFSAGVAGQSNSTDDDLLTSL